MLKHCSENSSFAPRLRCIQEDSNVEDNDDIKDVNVDWGKMDPQDDYILNRSYDEYIASL